MAIRRAAVDTLRLILIAGPLLAGEHGIARVGEEVQPVAVLVALAGLHGVQSGIEAVAVRLPLERRIAAGKASAVVRNRFLFDGIDAVDEPDHSAAAFAQRAVGA